MTTTTAIFLTDGNRVLDGPYGSLEEALRDEPFVLEQSWPDAADRPARLTLTRLPIDHDRA